MRILTLATSLFAAVLLSACSTTEAPPSSSGLVPVQAQGLDKVALKPGANLAGYTAVMIDAPTAAFRDRKPEQPPYQNPEDWRYRPSDLERAQKLFIERFSRSLTKAGLNITQTPGPGVLRLTPVLEDIYLNAPLREDIMVNRTYVEESGEMTLAMTLRDAASGELLGEIRDHRKNGVNAASPHRLQRFTGVRYWFDVGHDFQYWADRTRDVITSAK